MECTHFCKFHKIGDFSCKKLYFYFISPIASNVTVGLSSLKFFPIPLISIVGIERLGYKPFNRVIHFKRVVNIAPGYYII